jgi:ABC-type branched-subunit amino acid transport system substrate-binding protein
LAYDGIAAIGALAKSGSRDALSRARLTQSAGFQGVSGVFRFRPDGTNQRGLAVATIRDQKVVVIDPAPQGFGGAGF